jgi:glucosyl-3-phosphoglycerate phosphatase
VTGSTLPAIAVPRLVLWRHGRTEWNAVGRFQGQLDPPLDATGHQEAAAAAAQLVATRILPADTVVVSSDLDRTVQTANVLTHLLRVPLRLDARLREHGMGCWEGLTRDEVAERYPDQYADWIAGRPVRGRGGEEPAAVAERALAALVDLPEAPVAVVVTHGGTAGRLLERLLDLGPEHRRVFGPLANCSWSEVAAQAGRWRLLRHNISALPVPDRVVDGSPEAVPAVPSANGRSTGIAAAPATDADAVL